MYVYAVNSAATLSVQVSALPFGTSARTVKWSSDGRFLLVGGNDTASRDLILYIEFPTLTLIKVISFGTYIYSTDVHPNGLYLAAGGYTPSPASNQSLSIGALAYGQEAYNSQAISNSIVFGNSALGSSYDLNLQLLSGANVSVDGILNYDNTLGYTIFSNNNACFTLKASNNILQNNSEIRMSPNTVLGWRDRSLTKTTTGQGLGDYNLVNYEGANKIVSYAKAPTELVYDNSNAVVGLTVTTRINSNALIYLNRTTSNSIAWLYGMERGNSNLLRVTSNAANYLSTRVRTDSNALMSWARQTSNSMNYWAPVIRGNSNFLRVTSNALASWARQTSNSMNYWAPVIRGTSNWVNQWATTVKQTSNTANYLSTRVRTDSNAFLYGIKNNSNWINQWATTVKQTSNTANYLSVQARSSSNYFARLIRSNSQALTSWALQTSNWVNQWGATVKQTSNTANYLSTRIRTDSNAFLYGIKNNSNAIKYLSNNVQVFNTQQVYNHPATIQNFAWYKAGFQVDPGVILALNTPIPVNGQISLGGTLTLSSDLFLEAGATFTSSYGFGEIYGNGNAIHLGGNLAIPSNNLMHIGANTIIEGDGNTVNIGNNSQIFVDDNVTLTLRNVMISNNQNFANNPPIKLATSRSKLVLDNARLNFVNDFYFNQGELFCYNDVNFTGTSSFIYRSTVPSQIMSGANLKFNPKTTFYFEPATSGVTGLLAKDLLMMGDATSKLTLDGATLKTTLTGMRLTQGQLLLSNNVTMTSATSFRATGTNAILTLGTGIANAFSEIDNLQWSPDGRKLAVAGQTRAVTYSAGVSGNLAVYLFSGTTTSTLSTVDFSVTASGVSWSPDGQYLAMGGKVYLPASLGLLVSTSNLQIYSAANNFSSPVVQTNLGTSRASYTGPVSLITFLHR